MKVRSALAGTVAGMLALAPAAVSPPAAASPLVGGDQLYVTNGGSDDDPKTANIARFGIGADGLVTPVGTVPSVPAGGIVFTPDLGAAGLRFAYAATDDAIDRYRVGAGGALTFVGTTPASEPFGIAIDPRGPTVFVANFNDGESSGGLSAFHVEATGELTLVNTVDTGAVHPKGVAVTPDGRLVYVAHGTPGAPAPSVVIGFAVGTGGRLSEPVAKARIGPSGHRAVITPDGRFLYVTMQEAGDAGDVFGFRIGSSGELTPVSPKPFEAGTWVEGAAVSPDGKRLCVTALGIPRTPITDGETRCFAIGADGRLAEVGRFAAGSDPNDLAFGLDGRHLYVGDFTANTVTVFAVAATGAIKPVQVVSSQGLGPSYQGVTVQPRHF